MRLTPPAGLGAEVSMRQRAPLGNLLGLCVAGPRRRDALMELIGGRGHLRCLLWSAALVCMQVVDK